MKNDYEKFIAFILRTVSGFGLGIMCSFFTAFVLSDFTNRIALYAGLFGGLMFAFAEGIRDFFCNLYPTDLTAHGFVALAINPTISHNLHNI